MMTDIWEEQVLYLKAIHSEEDGVYKTRFEIRTQDGFEDWLERLKVEWDELKELCHNICMNYNEVYLANKSLKERAEKWDKAQEAMGDDPHLFSRQVERIQKLEAIKNWFNDWINPWLDKAGKEGFMLPKKRMMSLKKILEGEPPGN